MKHLVIGAGEVGTALAEVLDCDLRDVDPGHTDGQSYDVLHIAYPWSGTFTSVTDDYVQAHSASHVVVHSTVPPGICDTYGWTHSPIRGRHPDLVEGICTFTKHFGGVHAEAMAEPFAARGIFTITHRLAATTETGKLWELARLGIEVRVEKEINAYCAKHHLPFDEVYSAFTETYNDGFAELGEVRFIKPNLRHIDGPLGGHCVAQNIPMLDSRFVNDLIGPISPPRVQ